ncbi:hypothetical protein HK100_000612 [Physocladia obscura]|uniref:Uncharacterized protein n=1 Tax=Physocladia obscura TaxID=109957 RepID=A0AAD5T448_9FUNG|nr:hypothetical protein HK100_000612 [Physocladia obscura]
MSSWLTQNRTIVITGGATGIGLALTRRFAKDGNKVIMVGRRQAVLDAVVAEFSDYKVESLCADVETESGRVALYEQIIAKYPEVSVLVNNAGIGRLIDFASGLEWKSVVSEYDINLHAPIHLSMLFAKRWVDTNTDSVIASVTSGLAYYPASYTPVYCSSKAALHSIVWSMRHQFKNKPIKVIEIIPPLVATDFNPPQVSTFGANLDEFAEDIYGKLKNGEEEVAFGTAEERRALYNAAFSTRFNELNK